MNEPSSNPEKEKDNWDRHFNRVIRDTLERLEGKKG